jgi:putative SbcD/Mre11-related phosphoesterase
VDKVVIVGDLKHDFGTISNEEWNEIGKVIDYLKVKCNELIIIKGNHDAILESITKKRDIFVKDYYIHGEYAFVHGDKDFVEIYDKKIECWIMGHAHPAIVLSDGIKQEKYKCFLEGDYKRKKVIVLPSFIGVNEGTDVKSYDLGLAWKFELDKFNVKIINGLEVLDFGKLNEIG